MKSRDKLISLVALSAAVLGGCVSGGPSTLTFAHSAQPAQRDQTYLFRGLKTVDRDYIDRYACADGRILVCACTSLHARTCDCSC
jgi:hypothetical protein